MFTTESAPIAPPTASDASDPGRSGVARGTGAPAPGGIVTELRRALDRDEFRLHYQPVVDPGSGEIVGAEALLRWQHPDCGLLGPGDFLDAADRSDLTVEIAEWVIATALAECAEWPANWFVTINVSPRQLSLGGARGLAATIAGRCREHGLSPGRVWLELTEQGGLDDREVAERLEALRSHGLQVAVDDFGSGNASLGRLRTVPFDVCKLDRSLLTDLSGEAGDPTTRILRLAIELVHAFDGRVVAEGVETPEQLELLRTLDCDLVQGFHLARPMPPEELRDLVGVALDEGGVADHRLALYEDDTELERIVTDFLATGLSAGSSVVLVTTGQRRDWFATTLSTTGVAVAELRRERRLLELDADELLEAVLVDGAPDPDLLAALITRVLEQLAPGTGPVRIYSELATTLWQQGHTGASLCLEELANQLDGVARHRVLCAYPMSAFTRPGGHADFRALRAHHHTTAPTAAVAADASTRGATACGVDLQELALVHAGH